MDLRAPKGQYRVIGLDPIDTLTWPSGPLWKDCETFDEALDVAARNEELYSWIYVYDEEGKCLYEAGSHRQQLERIEKLNQEPPAGSKTETPKNPQ